MELLAITSLRQLAVIRSPHLKIFSCGGVTVEMWLSLDGSRESSLIEANLGRNDLQGS